MRSSYFYPRPPRGGRPRPGSIIRAPSSDFYPRPPRGGRHCAIAVRAQGIQFLSTPSARRATGRVCFRVAPYGFLSTPSARRATWWPHPPSRRCQISIHALREEGDLALHGRGASKGDFYPRPPRGGRPARQGAREGVQIFLSTPSARRATVFPAGKGRHHAAFLSTPSARRATRDPVHARYSGVTFLSTPSARRATASSR